MPAWRPIVFALCLVSLSAGCTSDTPYEGRRHWHHDYPRYYDDWWGPDWRRCHYNRWGHWRCHRRYFPR